MGSSNVTATPTSAAVIANHLSIQLIAIALFAGVVNGIALLAGSGPVTLLLIVLGNVAVLWMAVAAVIGALDDLLELKLERLDHGDDLNE